MHQEIHPKILIITTPIGAGPTTSYPPIGSMAVITFLKRAGFKNTHLYNIDLLRPNYEEVVDYIQKEKPDILGISAVVSTAYSYTKEISCDIKALLPNITIILGGNLGASAEVILKKTGVDYICVGEGEKTTVDFVNQWLTAKNKKDFEKVKGLAFLDETEKLIVTSYPDSIPVEDVYDIDWSILENEGQIDTFIQPIETSEFYNYFYSHKPKEQEPKRKNKTVATLVASKGCVARCTFCHRWDKGVRYIPVPAVMKRLDYFIDKYNTGFVMWNDENFGSDKKWLIQFLEEIKKRDLIWYVGGMRVSTISEEIMISMKDAGCVNLIFGMETGSQKILDVMEKKTTIEQNKITLKWITELGLSTNVRLVLGMPGESPETVKETIDFVAYYSELSPKVDSNDLAVNFAQALPGTALYEIGRTQGSIGQSVEDEEKYLLAISDRAAADGETSINFTDYPRLLQERWHFEILNSARVTYIKKWGLDNYYDILFKRLDYQFLKNLDPRIQSRVSFFYTLIKYLKREKVFMGQVSMLCPILFHRYSFLLTFLQFINVTRKYGFFHALKMLVEFFQWKIIGEIPKLKDMPAFEYISLRKFVNKSNLPKPLSDNPAMVPLRKGR